MNSTASNQISSIWTTSIDFINTFIIPSICFFGLVTNLVNIKVFLNKELKDIAFRYYLVNGFSNLFYLSICFFFLLLNVVSIVSWAVFCQFKFTCGYSIATLKAFSLFRLSSFRLHSACIVCL